MTEPYYAVADAMDPGTGQLLQDANGQSWKRGQPVTELVIRVLRTPRGQCPLDPTYGVDMTFVDKAFPDIAARWRAAVLEALRPYVAKNLLAEVAVTADSEGGRLLYSVSFVDVRARARRSISLSLVLGA